MRELRIISMLFGKILSADNIRSLEKYFGAAGLSYFLSQLKELVAAAQVAHSELSGLLLNSINEQLENFFFRCIAREENEERAKSDQQKMINEEQKKKELLKKDIERIKRDIIQLWQAFCHKYAYHSTALPDLDRGDSDSLDLLYLKLGEIEKNRRFRLSNECLGKLAGERLSDLEQILPQQKKELEKYLLFYQERLRQELRILHERIASKQNIITEDYLRKLVGAHLERNKAYVLKRFVGRPDDFLPFLTEDLMKRLGCNITSANKHLIPKKNSKGTNLHYYIKEVRDYTNPKEVLVISDDYLILLKQVYVSFLLQSMVPQLLRELNGKMSVPLHNLFWQALATEIEEFFTQGGYVYILNLNHASLRNKKFGRNDSFMFDPEDAGNIFHWLLVKFANALLFMMYAIQDRNNPILRMRTFTEPDFIAAAPYAEKARRAFETISKKLERGKDIFIDDIEHDLLRQALKQQKNYLKQLEELRALIAKIEIFGKKKREAEELSDCLELAIERGDRNNGTAQRIAELDEILEKIKGKSENLADYIRHQRVDPAKRKKEDIELDSLLFDKAVSAFADIEPERVYQVRGYEDQPLLISFGAKLCEELKRYYEPLFLEEIIKNTAKGVVRIAGENGIKTFYSIKEKTKMAEIKFTTAKNSNKRIIGYPAENEDALIYLFSEIRKK